MEGGVAEARAAEVRAAEARTAEDSATEARAAEARAAEGGAAEARTAEVRAAEAGTAEGGATEARAVEGGAAEARSAGARAAEGQAEAVRVRSASLSPEAWRTLRHEIARLAIDLVSGPTGVASALRRGLLDKPYNTPSLPLDVGYKDSIPGHIRRAVLLRDRGCAWPSCGRPAAHCDVHHLRHKADGGETSVTSCLALCQFHHDICVHRKGWQLSLHPDGTTEATSPDGTRVLTARTPPTSRP